MTAHIKVHTAAVCAETRECVSEIVMRCVSVSMIYGSHTLSHPHTHTHTGHLQFCVFCSCALKRDWMYWEPFRWLLCVFQLPHWDYMRKLLILSLIAPRHATLACQRNLTLRSVFLHLFFSPLQWEEEASSQHRESHPVQHERQEVHRHRGAQDQPVPAGLHQEPIRLHPGHSWQLNWAEWKKQNKTKQTDIRRGWDYDMMVMMIHLWFTSFVLCRAANVMIQIAALPEDLGNWNLKLQSPAKLEPFCRYLCNSSRNRKCTIFFRAKCY